MPAAGQKLLHSFPKEIRRGGSTGRRGPWLEKVDIALEDDDYLRSGIACAAWVMLAVFARLGRTHRRQGYLTCPLRMCHHPARFSSCAIDLQTTPLGFRVERCVTAPALSGLPLAADFHLVSLQTVWGYSVAYKQRN